MPRKFSQIIREIDWSMYTSQVRGRLLPSYDSNLISIFQPKYYDLSWTARYRIINNTYARISFLRKKFLNLFLDIKIT